MSSAALPIIRDLLVRRFGLKEEELSPDRCLATLGLDSIATVELVFEVESTLNIVLPELPPGTDTLGELVSFLDRVLAQQSGQGSVDLQP